MNRFTVLPLPLLAVFLLFSTACLAQMDGNSTQPAANAALQAQAAPEAIPPGYAPYVSSEEILPEPWERMTREQRAALSARRFLRSFEPTGEIRFDRLPFYVNQYVASNIIDPKSTVFEARAERIGETGARIEGAVLYPEYRDGLTSALLRLGFAPVENQLRVLPDPALGGKRWGLVTAHVMELRRTPHIRSEKINEAAFASGVRLLEQTPDGAWSRVISADGYIGWGRSEEMRRVDLAEWQSYFGGEFRAQTLAPLRLKKVNGETFTLPASCSLPDTIGTNAPARAMPVAVFDSVADYARYTPRREGPGAPPGDPGNPEAEPALPALNRPGAARKPQPGGAAEGKDAAGESKAPSREDFDVYVALPLEPPNDLAAIPARHLRRYRLAGPAAAERIVAMCKPYLDVPYVWGGITEQGLDCSGFTQHMFRMQGLWLARDADQQSITGDLVAMRGEGYGLVRPGDLLFFINGSGRISHVALSLGGPDFLHASRDRVKFGSFDPAGVGYERHYVERYAFARRPAIAFGE